MEFLIVLVVLAVVVFVVTGPLRRPPARPGEDGNGSANGETSAELAELEAVREAKYREIRDAELDHRTGKLSDADFEAIDSGLRAEAVEILHAIDRAHGVEPDEARNAQAGREAETGSAGGPEDDPG